MKTHAAALALGLALLTSPVLGMPTTFAVSGKDGERAVSGQVSFDSETRALSVTVGDLSLAGKAWAHKAGYQAWIRPTAGMSGGLTARVHHTPWVVTVQPKGLSISVRLKRFRRTIDLKGSTTLGAQHAGNEALIRSFYEAFARSDAAGMRAVYADDVHFSDTVFPNLHGSDAGDMWAMLCEEKPQITVSGIRADERYGVARWVAHYEILGNPVVNVIEASFEFKDGKIVRHVDAFPFIPWAKQAFGSAATWIGEGALLGSVRLFTAHQLRTFQKRD